MTQMILSCMYCILRNGIKLPNAESTKTYSLNGERQHKAYNTAL